MLYLDTHAIVYAYAGELDRFSKQGRKLLESEELIISPIVLLELEYLFEVGKVLTQPDMILKTLQTDIDLKVCRAEFVKIIHVANGLKWTRDPFDRMIVANAMLQKSSLLTKDKTILENFSLAFW